MRSCTGPRLLYALDGFWSHHLYWSFLDGRGKSERVASRKSVYRYIYDPNSKGNSQRELSGTSCHPACPLWRTATIEVHKYHFTKEIIAYPLVIWLDREIKPDTILGCYQSSYYKIGIFTPKIIEGNQTSVIIKVFFIPSLCSLSHLITENLYHLSTY